MTTREFIDKWNKGNHSDRVALVNELGLQDKYHEPMTVPTSDGGYIASYHFLAFPHLRAGAWYAKDINGVSGYLQAFRLYPRGMQTWNSFNKVITEANRKWVPGFKAQFCVAYDGVVAEEAADN